VNLLLAGEGAIAAQHAAALARIDEVDVVGLAGGDEETTRRFAEEHRIARWSLGLDEGLARDDVDAVLLATPTPLHAEQAIRSLEAGKHVLVEIPVAESASDARGVAAAAERAGRVAMVCHTRCFNASHRWVHQRIARGELRLQHLIVTTLFLRRENRNARGEPRSWTDHLLWHHACHTVDLFAHQTGRLPARVTALQGPPHPELGIAMDLSVGLTNDDGALCTLALSFNHEGPFGTTFRYVCDRGTYVASYDDLTDGEGDRVDVSSVGGAVDGIEQQDREFVSAVTAGREPEASVRSVLPTMETLARLEAQLVG
jgi:2-hydroxy-4-carboxymuconate semialdehyde hemiacetal dehydrogenase